ncbi:MAG: hypothetical protein WBH66_05760 [Rectinemataceae bacterium]
MMAKAATLKPWETAVIILMSGSEKVTADATRVPEILLMKSPSMRGMSACTTPSMRLGKDRNSIVLEIDLLRMRSRRSAVD